MLQVFRNQRGFTLLELLVVLTLVALLTAMVIFKLRVPYRAARAGEAVERIAFTDRLMRSHACNFSLAARIVYDLDRGQVYVETGEHNQDAHFAFEMPPGVKLEEVCLADKTTRRGRVVVESPSHGVTPSYAVRLSTQYGPDRWLMFAGLTGQVTQFEDERDVQQVFAYLDATGIDAH